MKRRQRTAWVLSALASFLMMMPWQVARAKGSPGASGRLLAAADDDERKDRGKKREDEDDDDRDRDRDRDRKGSDRAGRDGYDRREGNRGVENDDDDDDDDDDEPPPPPRRNRGQKQRKSEEH